MSFSRAKLNRFNDKTSDVPSPTRYDPKSGERGKGGAFSKTERERTVSQSSADTPSTCGTPFRTPFSAVKKHSCVASSTDRLAVVGRPITFAEPIAPSHQCEPGEDKQSLLDLTDALAHSHKIADELRQQNRSLQEQKTELEARLTLLDAAKADLECVISNNQNCEKRVSEMTERLHELEEMMEKITEEKSALVAKLVKEEEIAAKLEDGKIEYETRIVSLEGTLEQVKLEHAAKTEEISILTETSEKLKIANECLRGKLSSLESEVTRLESEMSEKEQTIFGLEEKASSLNLLLEASRTETVHQQLILTNLSDQLKRQEEACRLHESTIAALDLQIGEKHKEVEKVRKDSLMAINGLNAEITSLHGKLTELSVENEQKVQELSCELDKVTKEKDNAISERESAIEQLNCKINELQETNSCITSDLNARLAQLQQEIKDLHTERKRQTKIHEEEIFRTQNEWEKKMVEQVQEAEHALLEKDAILKLSELQHAKNMQAMRVELEGLLRDAEAEANRRQSAQLEAGEMVKAKYESRIADLESSSAQALDAKARQLVEAQQRYNEISDELTAHVKLLEERNDEISNLSCCNHKLTSRVSSMLEEIKILNAENTERSQALINMTDKFNEQLQKNDKLSEQLGELDSKISSVTDELKLRSNEHVKLHTEFTQVKDENNKMKLKNMDLQLSVTAHENRANSLSADLEASRSHFRSQLVDVNTELTNVKAQCYKFEIALANTRNSLEELGKRLIESECEIDRLYSENEGIRTQLATAENDKNEAENRCRLIEELKIDLEQRLNVADESEKIMQQTIKDLELKNCDFELTKNELKILQDTLEADKRGFEEALSVLEKAVTEKNLQMIETERACLEQIEAVSEMLIVKIDELSRFSAERIQRLNIQIESLKTENVALAAQYQAKCNEYESLNTDYDILKTTFDISAKESRSVKEHLVQKEKEQQEILAKLEVIEREKHEVVQQLETAHGETENLKAVIADIDSQKEILVKLNADQADVISTAKIEISAKCKTIDDLTTQLANEREAFDKKYVQLKTLKDSEVSQLQKEQKEYQASLLSNTDEIISLLANLESEGKKVSELEDANKSLSQNVTSLLGNLEEERLAKSEVLEELARIKNDMALLTEAKQTADKKHSDEIARLSSELQAAQESTEWKAKWQSLLEEKEAMASELLSMTEKKDHYKFHCQNLEKKANAAHQDYAQATKDFEELEGVLQEKEAEICKLQKTVAEFESLIGPFREQLETYEAERLMLENDREQLRKQHLEQAAKLGHQNQKQKIQHVVRLKQDILQLRDINQRLQCEMRSKNKIIESLREELGSHPKRLFVNGKRPTSTPFKGKENDERLSPLPTRVKQEAMSPSNPLRERNQ